MSKNSEDMEMVETRAAAIAAEWTAAVAAAEEGRVFDAELRALLDRAPATSALSNRVLVALTAPVRGKDFQTNVGCWIQVPT
jgi:hypothetical protein